jgi:hypothetical protein
MLDWIQWILFLAFSLCRTAPDEHLSSKQPTTGDIYEPDQESRLKELFFEQVNLRSAFLQAGARASKPTGERIDTGA